jgi:O-antigen/teichoic acid export membrane protein
MLYLEKFKTKITERFSRTSLHGSSFASDVLKLVGGTTIAQVLSILASPIITRMYGPEAFGLSALFASLVGIAGVVACLRYEMAIMLPEKDEAAANLLALSLLLAALMSMFMIPVVWLSQAPLLRLLNAPALAGYLWLAPPAVFLAGTFMALNYWNSRTRRFGRLSIARVNASVATTGTQIGAGLANHATGGSLIGASILGSAVSTLVLGVQIWRDDHSVLRNSIRFRDMSQGVWRYRKFPLMDTWSGLLNSISSQMPIFLFSIFFSASVVGYYALGNMVLQLPMTFIGSAVAQVFFQRAAEANLKGTLSAVVENTFNRLMMIGLYPILIIFLIGEDIFTVFFGSIWAEAGVYAQILALWLLFVFVTSPLSTLFAVFERQGTFLSINILLFIFRAMALIFGGLTGNARFALVLYVLVSSIFWIYICIWIFNRSKVPLEPIIRRASIYLCYYCLPAMVLIIIAKYSLHLAPSSLVFISLIGAIIYYTYSVKQDEILSIYLLNLLEKCNLK